MPARVGNVISAVAGFRTDHRIVVAGGLGQIFGGGAKEGRVTVSIPASASKYSRRAATPRCAGSLMSSKREYDASIYTSEENPEKIREPAQKFPPALLKSV